MRGFIYNITVCLQYKCGVTVFGNKCGATGRVPIWDEAFCGYKRQFYLPFSFNQKKLLIMSSKTQHPDFSVQNTSPLFSHPVPRKIEVVFKDKQGIILGLKICFNTLEFGKIEYEFENCECVCEMPVKFNYSSSYDRWTAAVALNECENKLDKWYRDLQKALNNSLPVKAVFKPLAKDGVLYMKWPSAFDKTANKRVVLNVVDTSSGGSTYKTPEEFNEYAATIAAGEVLTSMQVYPWIRRNLESGAFEAGVSFTLDRLI